METTSGTIIGPMMVRAQLFYDGRPESEFFYEETEAAVLKKGKDLFLAEKQRYRTDVWKRLYPLNAWEIRIYY